MSFIKPSKLQAKTMGKDYMSHLLQLINHSTYQWGIQCFMYVSSDFALQRYNLSILNFRPRKLRIPKTPSLGVRGFGHQSLDVRRLSMFLGVKLSYKDVCTQA